MQLLQASSPGTRFHDLPNEMLDIIIRLVVDAPDPRSKPGLPQLCKLKRVSRRFAASCDKVLFTATLHDNQYLSRFSCMMDHDDLCILGALTDNQNLRQCIRTLECPPERRFEFSAHYAHGAHSAHQDPLVLDLVNSVRSLPNLQTFRVSNFRTSEWVDYIVLSARPRYCHWYHSVLETLSAKTYHSGHRLSLVIERVLLDFLLGWCLPEHKLSCLLQNVTHVSISALSGLDHYTKFKQTYAWPVMLEQARRLTTLELKMGEGQNKKNWKAEVKAFLEACLVGQHWPNLSSILLEARVDEHVLSSLVERHKHSLQELIIRWFAPRCATTAVAVLQVARVLLTELQSAELIVYPHRSFTQGGDAEWYNFTTSWTSIEEIQDLDDNIKTWLDIGKCLIGYSRDSADGTLPEGDRTWEEILDSDFSSIDTDDDYESPY